MWYRYTCSSLEKLGGSFEILESINYQRRIYQEEFPCSKHMQWAVRCVLKGNTTVAMYGKTKPQKLRHLSIHLQKSVHVQVFYLNQDQDHCFLNQVFQSKKKDF